MLSVPHFVSKAEAFNETTTLASDLAQASLVLAGVLAIALAALRTRSGIQTREWSLKLNPKPKPGIRKGPKTRGIQDGCNMGPISWLCLPPNSALTIAIPRLRASAEFLR